MGDQGSLSATARLCAEGAKLEMSRDLLGAREVYQRAWQLARSDVDLCIGAHYVGHAAAEPDQQLRWHLRALEYADRCDESEVAAFYPSLYACVGRSLRRLGRDAEAEPFERRAVDLGFPIDLD